MIQNRHPRKVDGFTWGRVSPDVFGATTYRLFWRSSTGRLRMLAWNFPVGTPRLKGWMLTLCPEFPGEYDWPGVQNHWESWQAAIAHASSARGNDGSKVDYDLCDGVED